MSDDDWEKPERRKRDPAAHWAEKADCCADRIYAVCLIPRTRDKGKDAGKVPPARLRLCRYHSGVLLRSDPSAECHPIRDSSTTAQRGMQ